MEDDDDYPSEINGDLKWFNEKVEDVEATMKPLLGTSRNELVREMDSMEMIKIDLATSFTVNSLFWSYLVLQGVDPKTHPIKQELDRVQSYMAKVKEIEDKKKAPRLVKDAAKRFVRNAMFDLNEKNQQKRAAAANDENDDDVTVVEQPDTSADKSATPKSNDKKKNKKRKKKNKKFGDKSKKAKKSSEENVAEASGNTEVVS